MAIAATRTISTATTSSRYLFQEADRRHGIRFFYFGKPPTMGAIRIDDFKFQFYGRSRMAGRATKVTTDIQVPH